MQVSTGQLQSLTSLTAGYCQQDTDTATEQSMMSRHNCPCCSNSLLRHIRLGKIYWRCGHCHQEMAV